MMTSLLLVAIFPGCSQKEEVSGNNPGVQASSNTRAAPTSANRDPVVITFGKSDDFFTDADFERYVVEPVKKKYPFITVKAVQLPKGQTEERFQQLLTAGEMPDVLPVYTPDLSVVSSMKMDTDLEPLMKANNMDIQRFEPATIAQIKTASHKPALIGLPYYRLISALYYNKDIFDKFGIAYPKDGMTWEDATSLAVKLTRNTDGTQYRGLEPDLVSRVRLQSSLIYVDSQTDKAAVNTEPWRKLFSTMKSIYDIPGNNLVQTNAKGKQAFSKDQTLAMYASVNLLPILIEVPELNWDLAQYPNLKEKPNTGMSADPRSLIIPSASKNKEDAFLVISTVVSDEVQLEMSRNGLVTAMTGEKFKKEFGQNIPGLKGKHLESIYKSSPASYPPPSVIGDSIATPIMQSKLESVVKGEMDINTALRKAEEEINQAISAQKGK
jgi:multiple sugar transport system substrate-binding protein